ncbi:MAG: EAL domain-containing protein [Oleiphilus sp.]
MRKNPNKALWRTYIFIVGISLLVACAFWFLTWQGIKQDAENQQTYSNRLISHSISNYLNKYEAFLQVVGEHILGELAESDQQGAQAFLDHQNRKNPELVSIQLADAAGRILLKSKDFRNNKTLYLGQGQGNDAIIASLRNEKNIVMGRTYFAAQLDDWLIPLSLGLKNDKHELIGIISIDLKYSQVHETWFGGSAHGFNMRRLIMRKDLYRQYVSFAEKLGYEKWLSKPLARDRYELILTLLDFQLGVSEEELFSGKKLVTFTVPDLENVLNLVTVSYDPRAGLFTISATAYSELINRLLPPAIWFLVFLSLFNLGLYLLFRRISTRDLEAKQSLQHQVEHDPLTKLPNRRYLVNHFQKWSASHDGKLTLLYLDLNNFKTCNDIYGHSVGDRILFEAAIRISNSFESCLCIRQGGDEFIILSPVINESVLKKQCDTFLQSLGEKICVNHLEFSIQASIGAAFAPEDGQTLDELLRKADMAMYEAKRKQRALSFYTEEMEIKTKQSSEIEKQLRSALANNELSVVYQPQVDAYSHNVLGIEALVRWTNPSLGFVPPDVFIPVAEASGLIHEIGRFVMETALIDSKEVCADCNLKHKLRVSVNLSVSQLLNDDFVQILKDLLNEHKGHSITFMLEVTESLFIDDLIRAKAILEQIKESGVFISLDDFGTGYSSLSVLSKLPINELKIDRSFVNDILTDEHDWLLAKSIIYLCKSLSIPVVAEGVENKAQADRLAAHGCDIFQGYYFAKPLTKSDLRDYLSKHNQI